MKVLIGAILIAAIFPTVSHSEPVPHHSFMVENNAPAPECLSCHDGTSMKPAPVCTVQCTFRDPHIINTPYPLYEGSFRPPEEVLAAGIRLPNGLVTCISCHDLRNPPPSHLAVSNQQSRLCLTCHIK